MAKGPLGSKQLRRTSVELGGGRFNDGNCFSLDHADYK